MKQESCDEYKNKIEKTNKNWLDIRKVLSKCSERDLIRSVSDLYALSQSNKDFLETHFIKNDNTPSRYKEPVKKYIAPNEPNSIVLLINASA